jgi:LysM repeat protein
VRRFRRGEVARLAAPAAFLLAVTIAVLLVRAGLRGGGDTEPAAPSVSVTAPTATRASTTARPTTTGRRFYTVQSGDTFGSIAASEHTSVQELEALNPNVDPAALVPGQKIRVK